MNEILEDAHHAAQDVLEEFARLRLEKAIEEANEDGLITPEEQQNIDRAERKYNAIEHTNNSMDILRRVTEGCRVYHVVLMFSAVNEVDYSALESLEAISRRLSDMGVGLHLSEVKGPVMDRLNRAHFLEHLNGKVFLSQYDAWLSLRSQGGAALVVEEGLMQTLHSATATSEVLNPNSS